MLLPAGVLIQGRNVDVDPLDPVTWARFLAADASLGWEVGIVSAARSRAQQARLYRGYRQGLPGYNLAANPDWRRPDGTFGSRHQVQPDGHSYALDLARPPAMSWPQVHAQLGLYGLRFTVPGESWHCQALRRFTQGRPEYHTPARDKEAEIAGWLSKIRDDHGQTAGLKKVAEFVAACRRLTLRQGDTGPPVRFMQVRLNAADTHVPGHGPLFDTLVADGVYGPKTGKAVRVFQAAHNLGVDGVCGPHTWAALLGDGDDKQAL